jgi:hypothetical protein
MILVLAYSYKFFGYLFKLSSFVKIAVASAAMYILSRYFAGGQYAFILWSAVLFAIYLGILFTLKEFGASDLETVKMMLKRKKKIVADPPEEEVIL